MQQFTVLGDEEHFRQCRQLLHFSKHGTLQLVFADNLVDWGYLKTKDIFVFPMADSLTVFELTPKGRKSVKPFQKIWTEIYVPQLKIPSTEIIDEYLETGANRTFWALSSKRLESERNSGSLTTVLERCRIAA